MGVKNGQTFGSSNSPRWRGTDDDDGTAAAAALRRNIHRLTSASQSSCLRVDWRGHSEWRRVRNALLDTFLTRSIGQKIAWESGNIGCQTAAASTKHRYRSVRLTTVVNFQGSEIRAGISVNWILIDTNACSSSNALNNLAWIMPPFSQYVLANSYENFVHRLISGFNLRDIYNASAALMFPNNIHPTPPPPPRSILPQSRCCQSLATRHRKTLAVDPILQRAQRFEKSVGDRHHQQQQQVHRSFRFGRLFECKSCMFAGMTAITLVDNVCKRSHDQSTVRGDDGDAAVESNLRKWPHHTNKNSLNNLMALWFVQMGAIQHFWTKQWNFVFASWLYRSDQQQLQLCSSSSSWGAFCGLRVLGAPPPQLLTNHSIGQSRKETQRQKRKGAAAVRMDESHAAAAAWGGRNKTVPRSV